MIDNLWVIFLTGLTVGGLTCLAVQGGLLASVIAEREKENPSASAKSSLFATASFLTAKLGVHILLGFLLGAFGGVVNIGGQFQTIMQLFAGIYMVAVALNLLNIHPIFRYVIIQPPRFLTRLVRNQSKSRDLFAPSLLGAMTIFIPCGTTVAMETLAISSANAVSGALIMASFILGTIPLFFGIGALTSFLGDRFKTKFLKLAAVAVIYLGLSSINGSLVALNSPITFQTLAENFPIQYISDQSGTAPIALTTDQNPQIAVTASGYSPDFIRVKKGEEVHLILNSQDAYSCATAFRIPSLGIKVNLKANETKVITFTPTQTGKIQFNCSMGMYRGVIEVI